MIKNKFQFISATLSCLFSIVLMGFSASSNADSSKRLLMVSLGDSLTAATFADTSLHEKNSRLPELEKWPDPNYQDPLKEWLDHRFSDGYSIANKATLSWASGTELFSHYRFLQKYLQEIGEPQSLDVLNFAFPRDQTDDLDHQVRQLIEAMRSGKYSVLKYVTLMMGSNDACRKVQNKESLQKMRINLMSAFSKIAQLHQTEPIRILIVGIPQITELGSEYIRRLSHPLGRDCEHVRNHVLHFCDSLLMWKTAEEKKEKEAVIKERNQLIEETSWEAAKKYPHLDIYFTRRLSEVPVTEDILAMDCFHLNQLGQTQISEELWMAQPWFHRNLGF